MEFIEIPIFTKRIKQLISDEDYNDINIIFIKVIHTQSISSS